MGGLMSYTESIVFITEMHQHGMLIRMASDPDSNQETTYNIHTDGEYLNYSTTEYTESEIRRMLDLKAFW